jgi:hypothetical protein
MVEQDFPHPELLEEWNEWYSKYIAALRTVPGFLSGQRLQSIIPAVASYTAIYTLRDAGVMESAAYKAKFGVQATGRWRSLMTNWHRNLFEGVDSFPEVPPGSCLAVLDRHDGSAAPLPAGYSGMKPTGLDRSIVERGLWCLGDVDKLVHFGARPGTTLRIFKPIGD